MYRVSLYQTFFIRMICLFSYGTLQDQNVQIELYNRILTGVKDFLQGYKISLVQNTDPVSLSKGNEAFHKLAIATSGKDDMIEGTALEITEDELLLTDQYEPPGFVRTAVVLLSGRRAWVYAAR